MPFTYDEKVHLAEHLRRQHQESREALAGCLLILGALLVIGFMIARFIVTRG